MQNTAWRMLNYKKPAFWIVLTAVIAGIAVGVSLLANPEGSHKVNIAVAEIKSAVAWNDEAGISRELPAADFDNICDLVTSAIIVRENNEFSGTTPVYGIHITTKDGKGITINESLGDIEVQRDGRSWFIGDADLGSFVHDVCAVDENEYALTVGTDEPQDTQISHIGSTDIPDGFIVNEVGATDAEVSAIFADIQKSFFYDNYDYKNISSQGIHLYIYARQDWHDGALLLAGLSPMGEQPAELYHINGSGIVARTSDSDIWSINYTHYAGETIVFGESFAWDNGPLATDEVRAEFWSSETVTVPMKYTPNGEDDIRRGYICAVPSVTWLKSLKILKDGTTVADDESHMFLFDPANQPWYGEEESIRNRTLYVWTSDLYGMDYADMIDFFGGYPSVTVETPYEGEQRVTSELTFWPNDTAYKSIYPDIWHSNNGIHTSVEAIAGSAITAQVSAVTDNAEDSVKAADLTVSGIYWVDLSIKDDEKCVSEGRLVCPQKKGYYMLVLSTDYGYFSKTIRVV